MITLTTPPQINAILGGNAPVNYNKLVIAPFEMDPVNQTISGQLRLTATSDVNMQPIYGTLQISVPGAYVLVEIPVLDFYRRIVTSSAQNTSILNIIETAQTGLENGLINLGAVAGTRTTGA